MRALCHWLRTQPMTDGVALAICSAAAFAVLAVALFWGLPA